MLPKRIKSHKRNYWVSNLNAKFKILQYIPKRPCKDVAPLYTSLGINQG